MQASGNTILITGGTSGIGLAFAKQFQYEGQYRDHLWAQGRQTG